MILGTPDTTMTWPTPSRRERRKALVEKIKLIVRRTITAILGVYIIAIAVQLSSGPVELPKFNQATDRAIVSHEARYP